MQPAPQAAEPLAAAQEPPPAPVAPVPAVPAPRVEPVPVPAVPVVPAPVPLAEPVPEEIEAPKKDVPAPVVPPPEAAKPAPTLARAAPVPPPPTPPKPAPAAPPVSVAINATPWATIEIDGREVGETPLAGIMLPPGAHAFRARLPDGRVVERSVEIDAKNRFVTFR